MTQEELNEVATTIVKEAKLLEMLPFPGGTVGEVHAFTNQIYQHAERLHMIARRLMPKPAEGAPAKS